MASVAIVGAGALGGALAHKLAGRGRVAEIKLIDPAVAAARGKALDILQASPVESFSTRITSADALAAAAGADAIVLADLVTSGEIAGESGLALVRQIARLETASPLVFAGASQRELILRAVEELHVNASRLAGSAPLAFESAVRAITATLADSAADQISLGVFGVPPHDAVVAWDAATLHGQPISSRLPAHQLAAINGRLAALWPPGPYALASAAARVAEAFAEGSRRELTCFAVLEPTTAGAQRVAAVPVRIRRGAIERASEPVLSRHERTTFENGLR